MEETLIQPAECQCNDKTGDGEPETLVENNGRDITQL